MEPPDAVLAAASATSETSFLDAALLDRTMLLPCRRAPVRLELWMLMSVPCILTSQALSSPSVHSATAAAAHWPLQHEPLVQPARRLGVRDVRLAKCARRAGEIGERRNKRGGRTTLPG